MAISKDDTYDRARQLLEQDIKTHVRYLRESFYLQANYPIDIEGNDVSVDTSFSQCDVDEDIGDTNRRLQHSIRKLNSVQEDVEIMVSEIYDQMSEVHMTKEKIWEISKLLYAFTRITGEPWIQGLSQIRKLSVFLFDIWSEDMIPVDREAVWTKIPKIYADFMHAVNPERAGDRRPHRFT